MSNDNQWSSVKPYLDSKGVKPEWMPDEEWDRVNSYVKYDQMYWNDPRQYALRVLEDEEPLYIPNARTIVDTTSHYLLKGLELTCSDTPTKKALDDFLKREVFYSRFNVAKQSGVARGDFVMHLTANPKKSAGRRLSLNSVDPAIVFPEWDTDQPDKLIKASIIVGVEAPTAANRREAERDIGKSFVRKLTYTLIGDPVTEERKVEREEAIYEIDLTAFGEGKLKKRQQIINKGFLPDGISTIPLYWFRNRHWQGEEYGSSELRGLENITESISQGSTDVSAALALEGLGVYATDGGRPVEENAQGEVVETSWEVAPGKVMEVPSGSYFRRVEGVGSITPAKDQIVYLEEKLHEASGLSDVALGKVDAQVAQSGIALAIKFIPTLAKIETRDQQGIDLLTQLFFDWKTWYQEFENETLAGDIIPVIGDKLPTDRTAKVNELNNMLDRRVISTNYYRDEMGKLGYVFPGDSKMEKEIEEDLARAAKPAADAAALAAKTAADAAEASSQNQDDSAGDTLEQKNSSNNRNRPNESSGTEATDTRDA